MQQKKSFSKKLLSICVAIIFAVSPIFLSGCFDFSKIFSDEPYVNNQSNNSQNSGGSGSGSGSSGKNNSGSSQNNQNDSQFDESSILAVANEYIDTMLVTYSLDMSPDTIENSFEQISIFAIAELCKQFGYEMDFSDGTLSIAENKAKTTENSTTYSQKMILLNDLFGDNIAPIQEGEILNFAEHFKFNFSDYANGSNWQSDLDNAMEPVDPTDKTPQEIENEIEQKLATTQQIHQDMLIAYVNNLKIRKKFALGLILISANKNLQEFGTKAQSILGANDGEILSNSHTLFANYFSEINSLEFSQSQKTQLVNFVINYVLGNAYVEGVDNDFVANLSNQIATLLSKATCFANYDNSYTFVGGENEGMSGLKNYQSIVIMPKQHTQISELDMFFSTEKQSGVKVHLYLRYFDKDNGWANFGESNLYDLGTINIIYFSYDDDSFDEEYDLGDDYDEGPTIFSDYNSGEGIDIVSVLQSATFDGELPKFEQIADLGKNSQDVAVCDFENGKYFETLTIDDKQIVVFSQDSIETKQSYFEILFFTENPDDTFNVSINIEDEDFS